MASSSTGTKAQQPTIGLIDLDVSQLAEIKKQLEEEISHLTNSFAQLKQAQARFEDCIESIVNLKESKEGAELLLPLTESLYVPGQLTDTTKVIVDVGTGYFVEKSTDDAAKFYADKVDFIKKNLDTLQGTISTKQNNLQATLDVLQAKILRSQEVGTAGSS